MLSGEGNAAENATPAPPAMTLKEALADSAYRAAIFSSFGNGWVTFGVRMATIPLFAVASCSQRPRPLPGTGHFCCGQRPCPDIQRSARRRLGT